MDPRVHTELQVCHCHAFTGSVQYVCWLLLVNLGFDFAFYVFTLLVSDFQNYLPNIVKELSVLLNPLIGKERQRERSIPLMWRASP